MPLTQADLERWGTIGKAEAERILRRDLSNFEDEINRDVRVPLNQNQFDALVSLAFNIPGREFRNSKLLRLLNSGDYEGAAKEFSGFDHVHRGKRLVASKGLLQRRHSEEEIFLRR